MNSLKITLFTSIVILSARVDATMITQYGNLISDDATNYITDIVTNRQYTRFDAFNLSYADTLQVTGNGRAFEGWSIATADVADAFIDAALGVSISPCNGVAYGNRFCGTLDGWRDGLFGNSYNSSYDFFAYLSGNNFTRPVSLVRIASSGDIIDARGWGTTTSLDYFGNGGGYPINLLLYKDAVGGEGTVTVSEPGSLALVGLGLLGGLVAGRKKLRG